MVDISSSSSIRSSKSSEFISRAKRAFEVASYRDALKPALVFFVPIFRTYPSFSSALTRVFTLPYRRVLNPFVLVIRLCRSYMVSGLSLERTLKMARFCLASLPLNTLSPVPLQFFRTKVFCSPSSFGRKKEGAERCLLH